MELTYKGFSRLYVETEEAKLRVLAILEKIDPFEYENYCPDNFVAVYESFNNGYQMIYTGKYELDILSFFSTCSKEGIKVVILNKSQGYMCGFDSMEAPRIYRNFEMPEIDLFGNIHTN